MKKLNFFRYLACCLSLLVKIEGFVAPTQLFDSAHQAVRRRDDTVDYAICTSSTHQRRRRILKTGSSLILRFSSSTNEPASESVSSLPALAALPLQQLSPQLSPLEGWCARELEEYYQRAVSLKCPFMKRRLVDALDAVDMVLRFLVVRHKSLDIFGPPPGHRSKFLTENKCRNLSTIEALDIIRQDWKAETAMGYYITGNLNSTIYRDDCLFDGPDPDMPVRGLRKYVNAASQLFDRSKSRAELLSLEIVDEPDHAITKKIVARWRMNGVLRLPWKPNLPEWTGSTTYHLDDNGLVYLHEEKWDLSVWQAFMETFAPEVSDKIWAVR